ncbi:MAG TPA: hypothetical protein VF596_04790 [Pyrinomonadaceae bacterium]|jgi:hypothetical protein
MITVYSIHDDNVIKGKYLTCEADYALGIGVLFHLINKLDLQRSLQKSKLYERLERDLVKGCIMPPLTLAFLSNDNRENTDKAYYENYVNDNIVSAFVLDGIQRLNTLNRAFARQGSALDLTKSLFLNIIICDSKDKLLYRMITLNNGQKPMSARHQIEMLADSFLGGDDIPITIQREKESVEIRIRKAYKKADIVKGYIAYITGLLNYDNQKIIEEKMDELIAEKVLEYNIAESDHEFVSVLHIINRFSESNYLYDWFSNNNNLIGFCVGIKKSFVQVNEVSVKEFENAVREFSRGFDSLDVSKIKLQRERRKLVEYFIGNYSKTKDYGEIDFLNDFMNLV